MAPASCTPPPALSASTAFATALTLAAFPPTPAPPIAAPAATTLLRGKLLLCGHKIDHLLWDAQVLDVVPTNDNLR